MRLGRSILLSSGVRAVTLPIGALCSVTSAGLVIRSAGATPYGFVSVLGNLFQLFVFTDLGLGAVVVPFLASTTAADRTATYLRSLGRVFRLLWIAAAALIALAWGLALLGVWPVLLGTAGEQGLGPDLGWATAVTLSVFALSIPLGIGQRILLGLHANHVVTLLGVLAPLASLAWTAGVVLSGLPVLLAGAGTSVGLLLTAAAWMIAAVRRLHLPLRVVAGLDVGAPIAVWSLALPQLVITLLAPIGVQSDRIVLAQLSDGGQLAVYSLVSQLWTPLLSVVFVATASLWPAFQAARAGATGLLTRSWAIVLGAALAVGAAFVLLAGPVCALVSDGEIVPGPTLLLLFGLLFVVSAVQQVSALFLMDARGLRLQMALVAAALAVNLGVSILLAPSTGAIGPVIGSIAGLVLVQLVPTGLVALRRARAVGPADQPRGVRP